MKTKIEKMKDLGLLGAIKDQYVSIKHPEEVLMIQLDELVKEVLYLKLVRECYQKSIDHCGCKTTKAKIESDYEKLMEAYDTTRAN